MSKNLCGVLNLKMFVLGMATYLYVWAVHQPMKDTKGQSGWNSCSGEARCFAYGTLMNTLKCCDHLLRRGLIYFTLLFN